jgi:DNA-nicking Smr family endonuclease
MARRARRLSDAEQALWANYAGQLTPLKGRDGVAAPEVVAPAVEAAPVVAEVRAATAGARPAVKQGRMAPVSVGAQPGGLDRATWQRFRSGKMATVRTLDLHGMTVQLAFHALLSFLRTAHADQVRCVEVVTGRGSGAAGGVIRREFPHWLNLPEIRPLILAASHPHALNTGSVRLILRRIR